MPAMRAICDSFSATTWTDTSVCTVERSHTSAIAAIRLVLESVLDGFRSAEVQLSLFFSLH